MIAVLKHELKIYFHSITAYIFGAFLLLFVGIGALLYNIQAAVANFEYVFGFCSLIFVIIVPILTMRVIAEERKQKTDQLLYSLPLSASKIILGKYLALLVVYFVPLCIIGIYPLIFSRFGDVYLLTSYGTLIAFFVLGAALISVGVFISSLTENQGFVAGIGIAVILFNYFSVNLSENISATAQGSLVTLLVISVFVGFIVKHLTKRENFGIGVSAVLASGLLITFWVKQDLFEGLVPEIMSKLSLFERLNTFINGVFDLTAMIYYVSVIVFFLFLSVQSLEKRRYN